MKCRKPDMQKALITAEVRALIHGHTWKLLGRAPLKAIYGLFLIELVGAPDLSPDLLTMSYQQFRAAVLQDAALVAKLYPSASKSNSARKRHVRGSESAAFSAHLSSGRNTGHQARSQADTPPIQRMFFARAAPFRSGSEPVDWVSPAVEQGHELPATGKRAVSDLVAAFEAFDRTVSCAAVAVAIGDRKSQDRGGAVREWREGQQLEFDFRWPP